MNIIQTASKNLGDHECQTMKKIKSESHHDHDPIITKKTKTKKTKRIDAAFRMFARIVFVQVVLFAILAKKAKHIFSNDNDGSTWNGMSLSARSDNLTTTITTGFSKKSLKKVTSSSSSSTIPPPPLTTAEIEASWKGETVYGDPEHNRRVFLVISHCNEDLGWITSLTEDYPSFVNTTIATHCNMYTSGMGAPHDATILHLPYVRGSSHAHTYAYWMSRLAMDYDVSSNDVILFVRGKKDTYTKFETRSLYDMLRIVSVNGFACLTKPPPGWSDGDAAAYHETSSLLRYQKVLHKQRQEFSDLGDWLSSFNMSLPVPLTQVCYGDGFAVKAARVLTRTGFWSCMERTLLGRRHNSEGHYAERMWAGLFANAATMVQVEAMRRYATGRSEDNPYKGVLLKHAAIGDPTRFPKVKRVLTKETALEEYEWKGGAQGGDPHKFRKIILVVSHCNEDLSWIDEFTYGFTISKTVVYSKCDQPVTNVPKGRSTIVRLPNVGRCDHTYAYWMARYSNTNVPNDNDETVVVFLKAGQTIHQAAKPRTLSEMLSIASVNGFGCWLELKLAISAYHDTNLLKHFNLNYYSRLDRDKMDDFKSKFESLGDWWTHVGANLPEPITQVCYGGTFAVNATLITQKGTQLWSKIEQSLSRADNIQEGHYAERSWAGLLSHPLSPQLVPTLLKSHSNTKWESKSHPYKGALLSNKNRQHLTAISFGMYNIHEENLWKGTTPYGDPTRFPKVFVFISYCNEDLAWLDDFTANVHVYNMTIYSHCNATNAMIRKATTLATKRATIVHTTITKSLRKTHHSSNSFSGTAHHHRTYAHIMSNLPNLNIHNDDAVVFLKDDAEIIRWGRPLTLYEMLRLASVMGFSCRLKPTRARGWENSDVSTYHMTDMLTTVEGPTLSNDKNHKATNNNDHNRRYRDMAEWLNNLPPAATLPQPLTNVCYGDMFATKAQHITSEKKSPQHFWTRVEQSITTDQEGYFAERAWGGWLTPPPPLIDMGYLMKYKSMRISSGCYAGALLKKDSVEKLK